ncbi:MAG: hypothetical protein KKG32_07180 [Alphaproteobacteria bacterium]|nr:hypothetical protein [Alphaproteobacteria bacterium]
MSRRTSPICAPRQRHGRGQHAVELALLEPRFAPQDFEATALRQHVDHIVAAQQLDAVDGQITLVGQPARLQRPHLRQRFGRIEPDGEVGIDPQPPLLEPDLLFRQQQRIAALAQFVEVGDLHPGRRRVVERDLTGIGRTDRKRGASGGKCDGDPVEIHHFPPTECPHPVWSDTAARNGKDQPSRAATRLANPPLDF